MTLSYNLVPVSYTHLDVYKRQGLVSLTTREVVEATKREIGDLGDLKVTGEKFKKNSCIHFMKGT